MRFLADEDFPGTAVAMLRGNGHDVVWASEDNSSSSDKHLLEIAQRDQRIILTFDKDFGEIAFHRKLPASCGIVLFRGRITSLRHFAEFAVQVLESRDDWVGNFTLVEWSRIRMRPLK
jgi:predicted nuclease of predicted toxin-antitoxin system